MSGIIKDRLKALQAKTEDFTIPDTDIVIPLKGLTFNEMSEMIKYGERNDNAGAANYLLFISLRRAIPAAGTKDEAGTDIGMSDDEVREMINSWDAGVATSILTKVQELSGIKAPEPKN